MRIGRVVNWEQDVKAAWSRSSNDSTCPNSDVWRPLPDNVCWVIARVEVIDVPKICVIGSSDWKDVFGTYRLNDIAAKDLSTDDKHKHKSRILDIGKKYATGEHLETIAMVAFSGDGPYVVINGNHRAVAMARAKILVDQNVFLGLHKDIGKSFVWFKQAIEDSCQIPQ